MLENIVYEIQHLVSDSESSFFGRCPISFEDSYRFSVWMNYRPLIFSIF